MAKLRLLAAACGVTQPEAIEVAVNEALQSRDLAVKFTLNPPARPEPLRRSEGPEGKGKAGKKA